jgi:hypothetical protein
MAEDIKQVLNMGPLEAWLITEPQVNVPNKSYDQIVLHEGDQVAFEAGGCVQTGGWGRTTKRYVDPSGPNSDRLYHGLVKLPGMPGFVRVGEFIANIKIFPIPPGSNGSLELGYEDDNYGDNGYWGMDDPGTQDQCVGQGNAWVRITIIRHP